MEAFLRFCLPRDLTVKERRRPLREALLHWSTHTCVIDCCGTVETSFSAAPLQASGQSTQEVVFRERIASLLKKKKKKEKENQSLWKLCCPKWNLKDVPSMLFSAQILAAGPLANASGSPARCVPLVFTVELQRDGEKKQHKNPFPRQRKSK